MKKIISMLLILAILIGTMSSCAGSLQKEYMLKGDFFNMLLSEMNYYPIDNSWDEMNEADNYNIEAKTMADWGLLSSEEAFKGLDKPITKEIALVSLLNTMYFSKTGNVDSIKDAKMSDYPQEIADAIASGIAKLDSKNCINAKQKLTYEECVELIDNTSIAEANGHFEDEGTSGFEDCVVIDASKFADDPYFEIKKGENSISETSLADTSESGFPKAKVSFLGLSGSTRDELIPSPVELITHTYFMYMSKSSFDEMSRDYGKNGEIRVGDLVVAHNNFTQTHIGTDEEYIAGKITKIIKIADKGPRPYVEIYIDSTMTDLERIKLWVNRKNHYTIDFDDIGLFDKDGNNVLNREFNVDGWKVKPEIGGNQLSINVSRSQDYTISTSSTNSREESKHHRDIDYTFTLSNIQLDLNYIKGFFDDQNYGDKAPLIKFQWDTSQTFTLQTGVENLAPYDNGNGKAATNILNAIKRGPHAPESPGAKSIKLFSFHIMKAGFDFVFYVLLNISVDGTIKIEIEKYGNGFEIQKKNGHTNVTKLNPEEKKSFKCSINYDVGAQLELTVLAVITGKRPLITGYIQPGVRGEAGFQFYNDDEIVITETEVEQIEGKWHYCVWGTRQYYISFGLKTKPDIDSVKYFNGKESLLCEFLGEKTINKMQKNIPLGNKKGFHFEDGKYVDECTRGKGTDEATDEKKSEKDKEANRQGKFLLEKTKVTMSTNSITRIKIEGNPLSDKDEKNGKKICVRTLGGKENKLVFAHYEPATRSILVSSFGEAGSTELVVYISQNENSGKVCSFEYHQAFSVTVDNPNAAAEAYDAGGGGYSAAGGGTNSFGGGTMGSR